MKTTAKPFLMLLIFVALFSGNAQETPGTQSGVTVLESPVFEGMREPGDYAWLQVLNLAGNTAPVTFELTVTGSDAAAAAPEEFRGLAYGTLGNYQPFPSGRYDITVRSENGLLHEQQLTLDGSRFYTLALIGLQPAPEITESTAGKNPESGFLTWLRGIFGDEGTDRYALRLLLLTDNLNQRNLDNAGMVRLVNAAPGTDDVALAEHGADASITGNVSYGNVSNYSRIELAALTGPLEIRLGASRAATLPLDDLRLESGAINTLFVIGTPTEEAPLRVLISSTPTLSSP